MSDTKQTDAVQLVTIYLKTGHTVEVVCRNFRFLVNGLGDKVGANWDIPQDVPPQYRTLKYVEWSEVVAITIGALPGLDDEETVAA